MKLAIALFGMGRMGRELERLILSDSSLDFIGGISRKTPKKTFEDTLKRCNIVIDFSDSSSIKKLLTLAEKFKKPLVIGTTGYTKKELDMIEKASSTIPILYSENFSPGIALLKKFLKSTDPNLFSIKIQETHHKKKKDRPSGTAKMFFNILKRGRDIEVKSFRREEAIGKHKLLFSRDDEKLEITHIAKSRSAFAKGAILAAKFLSDKGPSLYSIEDIFQ